MFKYYLATTRGDIMRKIFRNRDGRGPGGGQPGRRGGPCGRPGGRK